MTLSASGRALLHACLVVPWLAFAAPVRGAPPDVVMSANRLEVPTEQVTASITVIGREEIERKQRRTLAELLEDVPGLNVVQAGGPGKQTSVFIRGTNSGHTLVLLDGIEVNDPSLPNPGFDYAHLLTDNVERVEILRGPQSTLYGSDAIGGVINVITRKGEGKPTFSTWAEAGSFGTAQESADLYGSGPLASYSLGLSRLHTRGISAQPERLGASERDGYDNGTASFRFGLTPTPDLDLGVVGRFIDTDTDLDVAPDDPDSDGQTRQLFLRAQGKLSRLAGSWNQTFGVSLTDHDRKDVDAPDALSADSSKATHDGRRLKLDWQHDVRVAPAHLMSLGLESERESVESFSDFRSAFGSFTSATSESVRTSAIFVQDQIDLADRWFGTLSGRLDHHGDFGSFGTYRAGLAYLHHETGTKLRGSLGSAFKAPALADLYGRSAFAGFQIFEGNPDLEPEKSQGFELGIEQRLLGGRVRVGTTYFQSWIRDLIEFTPAFDSKENRSRAEIDGFETFVHVELSDRLWLRLDHTFTEAEDAETNEDLLRRPKHKLSASADLRVLDRAILTLTTLYIGPRKDVDAVTFTRKTMPGYTVVNLTSSYDVSPRWRLFGRIDNLLDRDYEDPDGFGTVGFSGFAGVRAEY